MLTKEVVHTDFVQVSSYILCLSTNMINYLLADIHDPQKMNFQLAHLQQQTQIYLQIQNVSGHSRSPEEESNPALGSPLSYRQTTHRTITNSIVLNCQQYEQVSMFGIKLTVLLAQLAGVSLSFFISVSLFERNRNTLEAKLTRKAMFS